MNLPEKHAFCIGEVRLILTSLTNVDFMTPDPFYEDFLEKDRIVEDKPDEVKIDVVFGPVPDTRGMTGLFESGEPWSVWLDGGDYFVRFDRLDTREPYMAARFAPSVKIVTLFCSKVFMKDGRQALNPVRYPLDQILIMYYLSARKGAIIHASGIVIEGRGYLFPGRSGAGKTTIARILTKKKGAEGLSDDRVIARKLGEDFRIFGTPWAGDAMMAVNKSAPLSGILFPCQSDENRIERITAAEAFRRFTPVLSVPWYDRDAIEGIFSFVDELLSEAPAYLLHFRRNAEAAELVGLIARRT